jgi:hypothetical protein
MLGGILRRCTHAVNVRGAHARVIRDELPIGGAFVIADSRETRRIEVTLVKPWFALYAGVRPTVVFAGRGQPVQWGVGTWQVPADQTATIGVYLFNRLWRFGQAEFAIEPRHVALTYTAPVLPFLRGRIRSLGK